MTPELTRSAERFVLSALGADPALRSVLVLKGAHAVEALTQRARSTRDVDLTARTAFVELGKVGKPHVKRAFSDALEAYSEHTASVWSVQYVSVEPQPESKLHRFGWDGFAVTVTLQYRRKAQHVVEIDLSFGDFTDGTVWVTWPEALPVVEEAPEALGLPCYSFEQTIAEKLRAWLQKLPAYLFKIGSGDAAPRVRDLRDIHVLVASATPRLDYALLGRSFREKCVARLVDCVCVDDFFPPGVPLDRLRNLYIDDHDLADVAFDDACATVRAVVERLQNQGSLPGIVPMPVETVAP